ncbi:MAG TPA: pseudouridine synthase [Acidimicrobiales bacterium]|nr:pseudouridine synthase [Acidimicrobiales bacterium]
MDDGERLQKTLARAGFGSRRACEILISEGRVTIDGRVAELGNRVNPDEQMICVDGSLAPTAQNTVYYLLNKPDGVVTTASDPQGRTTVLELVESPVRIFPVGRLDMNTEGLLILTNDGRLAHLLTHPSSGIPKEYLARVEGDPSPAAIRRLRDGVELDDGVTSPAQVSRVSEGLLRIVIHEGRNRQVRRMCAAVGHDVTRLVRTRIGPIQDATLSPGASRQLSLAEVRRLMEAVGMSDTIASTMPT